MDRFDWKQYVCDMKELTEGIVNRTANDDMLKKLQWKNINNYRIEYDDDNSSSYIDFASDLFDDTKELIQPMKELLHVVASSCDIIEAKMCVIKIIMSYCENVYWQACCQKTCEENKIYLQMVEPLCRSVDELFCELKGQYPVHYKRNKKGW